MPNQLLPGQRLNPGDSLISNNTYYALTYQADGNLVLYDRTYEKPKALWDTGTGGRAACYVSYQTDGNFCVYAAEGDCVWDLAPRPLHPPINAIMQDDGNFVLYAITDVFDTTAMIAHAGGPQPAPRAPARGVNIQQITQIAGAANLIEAIIDLF